MFLSKIFSANESIVAKADAINVLTLSKKTKWVENFYNFAVFLNANTDNTDDADFHEFIPMNSTA